MRQSLSVTLFNPTRNSFGLLRILFASAVIVSHVWPLGGYGRDPGKAYNNLGILAVECFFALSGFLIARSATRLEPGRFLWHRMVRIFPAMWVCLLVIALVAAPVVWHTSHSLRDYPSAQPSPFGFLFNNFLIQNAQQTIGDTLASNPYPSLWDGPLYTLPFEFTCYIVMAMLIAFRAVSGRTVALLAAVSWIWLQLAASGVIGAVDTRQERFTLCFFVGALVYFARGQVLTARRWWIPLVAAVVFVTTYLTVGFFQLGLIALAYLCIWVGCVLPFHKFGTRRDYSYGMYIYGWPVLQLASFWSLNKLGVFVYLPVVLLSSIALAVVSWHLIESRVLATKNATVPRWMRADAERRQPIDPFESSSSDERSSRLEPV